MIGADSLKELELISVALRFNERINARDLIGLGEMMTADHVFIDSSGEVHEGRDRMITGWSDFFTNYPDYRNNFTSVKVRKKLVIMVGFSECSYAPLDGPAIWTAKIRDVLVAEWRVYEDTEEVRRKLDLK